MLVRFGVRNFKSILNEQVLDLAVPGKTPNLGERFAAGLGNQRVSRVAALFGANGSGKSTVLQAFSFLDAMRKHIPTGEDDDWLPFIPHRSQKGETTPTEYWLETIVIPGGDNPKPTMFRYRVVIRPDGPGTTFDDGRVLEETLHFRETERGVLKPLMVRQGEAVEFFGRLEELNRSSAPKSLAKRLGTLVVAGWQLFEAPAYFEDLPNKMFRHRTNFVAFNLNRIGEEGITKYFHENPNRMEDLSEIIRRADIGIENIRLIKPDNSDESPLLVFSHKGLDKGIIYSLESQGTQNFVETFPILSQSLSVGGVALMDDVDGLLHPHLLEQIVSWFFDPRINKGGGQLIMTCNAPSLLEVLEKEEVYFVQKGEQGETTLHGLKEIRGVDRDENFYRGYLSGRYGGLPSFG